jgi:CRP-like cAMP-binding protein
MSMFSGITEQVEKFIALTSGERDYFMSMLRFKKVRKKSYVLQAGDVCRHKTYVESGCLRAYYVDRMDREHIIRFAVEGWWIEDLQSFISGEPARLEIDAIEDSEIIQIDKLSLEELFEKIPKFETFFRLMIQKDLIAQQQRILMDLSMEAKEKYSSFLNKCAHLEKRLPQHQIASFLGITPQFLSQIRSEYKSSHNGSGMITEQNN